MKRPTSLAPAVPTWILLAAAFGACTGNGAPADAGIDSGIGMDASVDSGGVDSGGVDSGGVDDSPRDGGVDHGDDAGIDGSIPDAGPDDGPLNLRYRRVLLRPEDAAYNPTDEFIFPVVIDASAHIEAPLGRYYLYYAPHDAPGGVAMMYADSLEGPYTEYAGNPILTRTHQGKFEVSHVSSPHVVWMPQYETYFMYFHGENTTTRWAHSEDGVSWEVPNDNVALSTADWGTDFTECSYAKVFEHAIPRFGSRYVMLMMLIRSGFGRRIALATSEDGKRFTPREWSFIAPTEDEGTQLAAPFYWARGGRHTVLYHSNTGNIYEAEVGAEFDHATHLGVFYDPDPWYPEYDKASAPFMLYADDRWHMFYDVGTRLQQSTGYAFDVHAIDLVVDNRDPQFSTGGSWSASTAVTGFHGDDYLVDGSEDADPGTWAKWKPTFPASGYYRVFVRWAADPNRADAVRYNVYHRDGVAEIVRDQRTENGSWVSLGRFYFAEGSSEDYRLTVDAGSDGGYVVADAAWFIYDD